MVIAEKELSETGQLGDASISALRSSARRLQARKLNPTQVAVAFRKRGVKLFKMQGDNFVGYADPTLMSRLARTKLLRDGELVNRSYPVKVREFSRWLPTQRVQDPELVATLAKLVPRGQTITDDEIGQAARAFEKLPESSFEELATFFSKYAMTAPFDHFLPPIAAAFAAMLSRSELPTAGPELTKLAHAGRTASPGAIQLLRNLISPVSIFRRGP